MCGAGYIALEIDKNEVNAHFVAVSGYKIDVERYKLRVENSNLFGNQCFGVECAENSLLSFLQHL